MMHEAGPILRVAATVRRARTLGPGERFGIWVQGCPFACPGCIAPDFLPMMGGAEMRVDDLVSMVAQQGGLDGVTVSGGEPLAQPEAVAALLSGVQDRGLGTILFTGYRLEQLERRQRSSSAVAKILGSVDVLIDGLYEHALNDSLGLRGSSNQTMHFLTGRYRDVAAAFSSARRLEVRREDWGSMLVGIPTLAQWQKLVLEGADEESIAELSGTEPSAQRSVGELQHDRGAGSGERLRTRGSGADNREC